MHRSLLLLAVVASGCATYALPPTLYSASSPVVPLHDGPGEVRAAGRIGVGGAEGMVIASPTPHVGVHVRGSSLIRALRTADAVEQRQGEVGVTFYGPTDGALRSEIGVGVARGNSSGQGRDAVERCPLFDDCGSEAPEWYRADAALRQTHITVTLGRSVRGAAVALTGRLSRVAVSDVTTDRGGRLPDARESYLGAGLTARMPAGPATFEFTAGAATPLGETTVPDDGGPPRTLGGRYRSVDVYSMLGVAFDLAALFRGDG